MKTSPLVRVRDRELSLWQSVVAEEALKKTDRKSKKGEILTIASIQDHPMIAATNRHVSKVFKAEYEAPLGLSSTPRKGSSAIATQAYISELCFHMAKATIREDQELLEELEKKYRKYSDDDPGFLGCIVVYKVFHDAYDGILKYNSWEGKGMDYGLIKYKIPNDAKVAIIGDWGTGMSDAYQLLKTLLFTHNPDVLIHLGDIYYSGTPFECAQNFSKTIDLAFKHYGKRIPVFSIPGNHDYYAFGYGYYHMVKGLNEKFPSAIQDSSFFCLRTEDNGWQFLGMDTSYYDSYPLNQIDTYYAGPWLKKDEISWHYDKLKKFKGATILLSHHQLFSGNAKINGSLSKYGSYPYLNKYLLDAFRPFLGDKVAAWLWGHEHNQVIFKNGLFGLPKGRLVGASAFEQPTKTDPYKLNYNSVPFSTKYKLKIENGYYNHGYAIIDLANRDVPAGPVKIEYYQYPSWGEEIPDPIPDTPSKMFEEKLALVPKPKGKAIKYKQHIKINMEGGIDYIIKIKKHLPGEQYYPRVGKKPIKMQLLGKTGTVKDGDVVQIKSLESGLGRYNLLGAFSTPALYYYFSWGNNTKWVIKKVQKTKDTTIYESDAVYFINKAYNKQYLCPLIQVLYPGVTSLTTDEKVPACWYLKGY